MPLQYDKHRPLGYRLGHFPEIKFDCTLSVTHVLSPSMRLNISMTTAERKGQSQRRKRPLERRLRVSQPTIGHPSWRRLP